jgi:peptidyl-dipeptidase Dcp
MKNQTAENNPLMAPWEDAFGLPPFEKIHPEHFAPAMVQAMQAQLDELDVIAANPAAADFDNTVAALDRTGQQLFRLDALLGNLSASASSPALQEVQRELAPKLAAHEVAVRMHAGVFKRLEAVYQQMAAQGDAGTLSPEARRLVDRLYTDSVRAGARFSPQAQQRYSAIMQELAELCTRFAQNVLADESAYQLVLRTEDELKGLPEFVRVAARQAAAERGLDDGAYVITLNRSLIEPFLTFSDRRDLREQAWRAWAQRGEKPGATDNRDVARRILALRNAQARAHGFESYADYALADTMAGEQKAVSDLLGEVWKRAVPAAERERQALMAMMRTHGVEGEPEAWDWRYWSEKVRKARYDLDESEIKPYFELNRMVAALFDCAQRLFGVRFEPRLDLHGYHPDVKVYEMFDAQGQSAGLFLHDNFARPTKRSGAWMSELLYKSRNRGVKRAIVLNNNNFAKAAPGQPSLLSFDDARTLFHEFGHGLHGLLSEVTYHRLSGTQVLRDFVELPSQLFEHWLSEPEVLQRHARHWQTDEPLPEALLKRLQAAEKWGAGYATVSYTGSALVDLEIHALTSAEGPEDVVAFEKQALERLGMPTAIGMRHRLTHFQHLFSDSAYAAGYYSYIWAEVLEADAFNAFVEAGSAFDPEVAQRLLRHIYAAGGTADPRTAYTGFRGRLPALEPLLSQRGLLEEGLPAA